MGSYQEDVLEVYASAPGAEEGVRAIVRHYLSWMSAHADLGRFLLSSREPEVRASTSAALEALNERFYRVADEWLTSQIEACLIRPMPGELFRMIVVGPSEAFVRRWFAGRLSTPLQDAAEELAEAAWRAVCANATITGARAHAGRARRSRRSPRATR
jgi:hypothetical protein